MPARVADGHWLSGVRVQYQPHPALAAKELRSPRVSAMQNATVSLKPFRIRAMLNPPSDGKKLRSIKNGLSDPQWARNQVAVVVVHWKPFPIKSVRYQLSILPPSSELVDSIRVYPLGGPN
jgi:hypothetical protein